MLEGITPACRGSLAAAQEGRPRARRSQSRCDFHQVRKLAKRARYTAELIAPALGTRTEKAVQAVHPPDHPASGHPG